MKSKQVQGLLVGGGTKESREISDVEDLQLLSSSTPYQNNTCLMSIVNY